MHRTHTTEGPEHTDGILAASYPTPIDLGHDITLSDSHMVRRRHPEQGALSSIDRTPSLESLYLTPPGSQGEQTPPLGPDDSASARHFSPLSSEREHAPSIRPEQNHPADSGSVDAESIYARSVNARSEDGAGSTSIS